MPQTPMERAESLLFEAVLILFTDSRANDFPETYIRSLATGKIPERLHELRTLDDPGYRGNRAEPVALPEPTLHPASSGLKAHDEESFRWLLDLADRRLAEAINALCEGDAALAEDSVTTFVQGHMVASLRRLREQETPSERTALVIEVNRKRASFRLPPKDLEHIVTVLPDGVPGKL